MGIRSLNRLRGLRLFLTGARRQWLVAARGIEIDRTASISLSSRMLSCGPGSINVGADSLIAFKTLLITRLAGDAAGKPIRIGPRCFIGGGSTIMPGVTIGEGSIVGGGAVVFDDVPAGSIVGGNPAKILRSNITVGRFGRLSGADENTRRLWIGQHK